jgi:hypothetical protein
MLTLFRRDSQTLDFLHAQLRPFGRFALVPSICLSPGGGGVDEVPAWQIWTDKPTTSDQLQIEDVLEKCIEPTSRILHIGIGNSSLAKRFSSRVCIIDGTTLHAEEKFHAEKLELPNYNVYVCNKYGPGMGSLQGRYDFIVDNNPFSFACCLRHASLMIANYAELLLPVRGVILTALPGYGWVTPNNDPNWALEWDEWSHLGRVLGMRVSRVSDKVYSLGHRKDLLV